MKDILNNKNLLETGLINSETVSLNKSTKNMDSFNFKLKGVKIEASWRTDER